MSHFKHSFNIFSAHSFKPLQDLIENVISMIIVQNVNFCCVTLPALALNSVKHPNSFTK